MVVYLSTGTNDSNRTIGDTRDSNCIRGDSFMLRQSLNGSSRSWHDRREAAFREPSQGNLHSPCGTCGRPWLCPSDLSRFGRTDSHGQRDQDFSVLARERTSSEVDRPIHGGPGIRRSLQCILCGYVTHTEQPRGRQCTFGVRSPSDLNRHALRRDVSTVDRNEWESRTHP